MARDTIWLRPAPGRRVRDPISGKVCSEEPAAYPTQGLAGSYYARRRRDGDMIEASPPTEADAQKPTPARSRAAISGGE